MNGELRPDVLVIGGGVVGCATALYLAKEARDLSVTVVEPDPTYALAATPRASGGVRQLFFRPENIQLSQYTLQVIAEWNEFARVDGDDPPDLGWKAQGYLLIAGPEDVSELRTGFEIQRAQGVRAEWIEPGELAVRYPLLAVEDLAGGVISPDDGWLDPSAMLGGLRRAARGMGVTFLRDQVTDLSVSGSKVTQVQLASGEVVQAGAVVNAAGTWAPDLAAKVGMELPVEPMRRFEHYVESPDDLSELPFIKDVHGLAVRPEGAGLSVGLVDFGHPGGFDLTVDRSYFERRVWPALVHRAPRLEKLRLRSTSVGLYDQNRLDGNAIIGNWPGRLDNFYVACGFSGHGLMHAPGMGRALTELIVDGRFRSIDLARFGYERILAGRPYAEKGIK